MVYPGGMEKRTRRMIVYVEPSLHAALEKKAAKQQTSVSSIVHAILARATGRKRQPAEPRRTR